MRGALIGLLLAATVAAPALADKGGNGHGGGPKGGGGGWHQQAGGGGPKGGGWDRGGGGGPQRAVQAQPRFNGHGGWQQQHPPLEQQRGEGRGGWQRQQRFDRDFARQARFDNRGKDHGRWQRGTRLDRGFAEAHSRRQAAFRERNGWRGGWREARFDRVPASFARFDDKQARKAWKRDLKNERRFQRAMARQDWVPSGHRWARPALAVSYRQPVWYGPVNYAPRFVRYAPVAYAPLYYPVRHWYPSYGWDEGDWDDGDDWHDSWWSGDYAPLSYGHAPYRYRYSYDRYDDYDYAPAGYAYGDSGYSPSAYDGYDPYYGSGWFGGDDLMLAALLPILLQSVMGGDTAFGSLAGYDNSLSVLPLQQVGYAPYLSNGGYSSLLLPSTIGNSFF